MPIACAADVEFLIESLIADDILETKPFAQ